ncbi:TcpE family conjugal transfer membrane protein [Sinosporangium siamense]|uniref:MinD-like ATPase involved in chromosome partitioning or flagellar assembly n=1 Tax=Sinosporangium siamense TaxID=1367973 RepID=A0A919RJG8_9ACTN|nr:TcpE family conjugal transfer membrane protein [Sinosporangium siamense]GII93146.1 hypothetical protein Ssi02_33770 [Sinosporangium siamense]
MDLPTYTNIWRIEKRLYKLYDLRLPMPLPIVWIGVFVGVLAPWSLLLWLIGISFEAPWHVLYLVPPGVVTWLSTRPVIESKRLTELIQSYVRYLSEPRTWCRMTPLSEPSEITLTGRVWRTEPARVKARHALAKDKAKDKAKSKAKAKDKAKTPKREAAPAPGRVRPAVAAAAAAATRAPLTDTTSWTAPALPPTSAKGKDTSQATGDLVAHGMPPATTGSEPARGGRRRRDPWATPERTRRPADDRTRAPRHAGSLPGPSAPPAPATPQGVYGEAVQNPAPALETPTPVVPAASPETVSLPPVTEISKASTPSVRPVVPEASSPPTAVPVLPEALAPSALPSVSETPTLSALPSVSEAPGPSVLPTVSKVPPSSSAPDAIPVLPTITPVAAEATPGTADESQANTDAPSPSPAPATRKSPGKGTSGARKPTFSDLSRALDATPKATPAEPASPSGEPADEPAHLQAAAADAPVAARAATPEDPAAESRQTTESLREAKPEATQVVTPDKPVEVAASAEAEPPAADVAVPHESRPHKDRPHKDRPHKDRPEKEHPTDEHPTDEHPTDEHSADEPPAEVKAVTATHEEHPADEPPAGAVEVTPEAPTAPTRPDAPTPHEVPGTFSYRFTEPAASPAVVEPFTPSTDAQGTNTPETPKPETPHHPTPAAASHEPPTKAEPPVKTEASGQAPIGAEALRRLRRLAATADPATPVEAERAPVPVELPRAVTDRWTQSREKGPESPHSNDPKATRRNDPDEPQERTDTPALPPVSIRAVPSAQARQEGAVLPPVPGPRASDGEEEPRTTRVRRVESVVGRDPSGGWRRLAQVVIGTGGSRTDGSEVDEARTRGAFAGSRRIVVLGCTGGAGQTTTALMLGHTFARFRDERILAVDANTGANSLSTKIKPESPETLSSLLSGIDQVGGYLSVRNYTSRCPSGLEVVGADTDAAAAQRLADRTLFSDQRLGQAMGVLDNHFKLMIVDPAAALAARVLPYADQLVLVVPANEDAAEAVAMTYEWLDGHGSGDLRRRAVLVVNGVSRRSMPDVEQAEAVASGRCRAIVRVPWEDDLAPGGAPVVDPARLRAASRRAYLALAGVVTAGFGGPQRVRHSEEEVAQ